MNIESREFIERCLAEYFSTKHDGDDAFSACVWETALYVEETFSIIIPDEDINTENLGSRRRISQFVLESLTSR